MKIILTGPAASAIARLALFPRRSCYTRDNASKMSDQPNAPLHHATYLLLRQKPRRLQTLQVVKDTLVWLHNHCLAKVRDDLLRELRFVDEEVDGVKGDDGVGVEYW
jgi:hypothetical protein